MSCGTMCCAVCSTRPVAHRAGIISLTIIRWSGSILCGIGLNELTRLCHALDDGENAAAETLERVRRRIAARRAALSSLDLRLGNMISAMAAVPGRENGHV